MTIYHYISYYRERPQEVRKFLVIFYIVGTLGMILPWSFPLFVWLTPLALLVNFVVLSFFHQSAINRRMIGCFVAIFLLSFVVEAMGVATGKVFGGYEYGRGLGPKLFHTPLMIGLNWLFLVYTTASVVEGWKLPNLLKVVVASLGMLLYDLVMEQVAPAIDLWHWKGEVVPLQNYCVWFILALFFHSLLKIFRIRMENPMARMIFGCQFLFFLTLYIFFKIIV
ncbi:MAG TPA: carotenoid biosynthesis protein [Prolixibacteraceae bacterium]|nr:carotenoid biosynthesis protein [Prolixibacteraceae bacterium]